MIQVILDFAKDFVIKWQILLWEVNQQHRLLFLDTRKHPWLVAISEDGVQ